MKLLLRELDGNVRVIADSAIARNRQPWFLPDFGCNWRWRAAMAFRISRLGKNIVAKFADRYIDAVTMLWIAEGDNFVAADYMDGTVVCGDWMPVDRLSDEVINDLVEVTRYATVKNGDILARILVGDCRQIMVNSHISLNYKDIEVIQFNIK